MKNKLTAAVILFLLVFTLVSCNSVTASVTEDTKDETENYFFQDDLVVTDAKGNTFTLSKAPERVICATPVAGEILAGIGASMNVVACDVLSSAFLEGNGKAEVVSFVDAAVLLSYSPDAIFVSPKFYVPEATLAGLEQAGVKVIHVCDEGGIDAVRSNIRFFGSVMFKNAAAESLIEEFNGRLALAKAEASVKNTALRVYIEHSPGIYAMSSASLVSQLCEYVGFTNLYRSEDVRVPAISIATAQLDPELVVSIFSGADYSVSEVSSRAGWENVTAVKTGKIIHIDYYIATLPTPGCAELLFEILEIIK